MAAKSAPELVLSTDGASRGNPGPAGAGVLIVDREERVLVERAVFLGEATNNQAEYRALIVGLEEALRLAPSRLLVRMDSELIVRQLNGQYRVRNSDLLPLFRRSRELLAKFENVCVAHVPRTENLEADRLANRAIDLDGPAC